MIPITKPHMPPREEYEQYLKGIWEREYLTNNGPLVQELEARLEKRLGVKSLSLVSNGTTALQIALKALEIEGEVITTPFSFVATTSSIIWEGSTPVFVDINPHSLNIDPTLIEYAITEKTTAIVATHVFGNPCDIEAIQQIADRYDLKVIYDAAHCFGTKYKGRSVFNYGDISTASFHATKVFHTVEGGGIMTSDPAIARRVDRMRNFGYDGPDSFKGVGINGKNSEFHAAMGLCNLNYVAKVLKSRRKQWLNYQQLLQKSDVRTININKNATYNYAYYPAIFTEKKQALEIKEALVESNIYPRRYFYPSLNQLDYTPKGNTPFSDSLSEQILCLPLFHELTIDEQKKITEIINDFEMVELL